MLRFCWQDWGVPFTLPLRVGLYPRTICHIHTASFQLGRSRIFSFFLHTAQDLHTFRVRYGPLYNTIGGNYYNSKYTFSLKLKTSSSRARCDLLGATRRRFLLSEEGEVIGEQLELGALLESPFPRLCLVIYFSEFL